MLRGAGEITHVVASDALLEGPWSGRAVAPGPLRARLAAMLLDWPGDEDGFCFSEHSIAEWSAAIGPLHPCSAADLRAQAP